MPLSMVAWSISAGVRKYGGWKASISWLESCERSSSTTAMGALCRVSGRPVAEL
ncbi:hypothetical protein D9M68_755850 [compost metagenome]